MTRLPGDRAAPADRCLCSCPNCYDHALRASTGVVRGRPCDVCGGTTRNPTVAKYVLFDGGSAELYGPFEPMSCGYNHDADGPSGEVYDAEMREISGAHIGVNPDGTITPFRGRPH